MKKLLILFIIAGFLSSSCSVGWSGKFHKENWGTPKPKKAKKGKNYNR